MALSEKRRVKDSCCPYWSQADNNCQHGKSGLYLPVVEHITTYCQTEHYGSCPRYMGAEIPEAVGSGKTEMADSENRRRYQRLPGRYSFRLFRGNQELSLASLIDDSAFTIDLSPGGIRFESHQPVQVGTVINFLLNGDFAPTALKGQGQVRWCMPLRDTDVYHAGIAFSDTTTSAIVRSRLGLSVS